MEAKQYYQYMQEKIAELEENMEVEDMEKSKKYCDEMGERLFQHPIEFYFCINDWDYKQSVIKKLNLREDDVLLDVGTGVADLPLMVKDKVKEVYALELHKEIYEVAKPHINGNIHYLNIPFQHWKFPKEITKAVLLAWHCSELTLLNLIEKLKETDCRILVHNVGKSNSIQVKIIGRGTNFTKSSADDFPYQDSLIRDKRETSAEVSPNSNPSDLNSRGKSADFQPEPLRVV